MFKLIQMENLLQKEKSIVIKTWDYKLERFLKIHDIKHTVDGSQVTIFYNTDQHLFNIGFHYGRFFQLQND